MSIRQLYPYSRNNKKRRGGMQYRAILKSNIDNARHQQEQEDSIAPEKPSDVFVQNVPGTSNPIQRAHQFNLSLAERQAFVASRPRIKLFEHQEAAVAFMKLRETPGNNTTGASGGILYFPPRTGKTKAFLTRAHQAAQECVAHLEPRFGAPTLLVVPKNVIDTMTYENDDLFDKDCELRTRIILSDTTLQKEDIHAIIASYDLVITSYSTLMAFYQRWTKSFCLSEDPGPQIMFKTRWRRVIADEAHRLANNKNVVFDAVAALRADHFWYVTATPIQNAASDVLSALRFLRVHDKYINMESVPGLLQSLLFRRDYDDLIRIDPMFAKLKPPSRESMQRFIDFDIESEKILYKHVQSRSLMHLNSTPTREYQRPVDVFSNDVRPENMGLRLRQACVSAWLLPENFILPDGMRYSSEEMDGNAWMRWVTARLLGTVDRGVWPPANVLPPFSSKERYVLDYIRINVEPSHEKIVIFSEWTSSLHRLHELIKWRASLRQGHRDTIPEDGVVCVNGSVKSAARKQAVQNMWSNPAKYIMLVTLQSGGVGEDFTFANHALLIDPWWTPATEFQALTRIIGMKQTRPINIIVLSIANTVEDYVQARANQKLAYESVMQLTHETKRQENDQADDPMIVSDGSDEEDIDPMEEPAVMDESWMSGFLEQIREKPQEPVYHFHL